MKLKICLVTSRLVRFVQIYFHSPCVCRLCEALGFGTNFYTWWICLLNAVSPAATHMVLKIICIRPLETIAQHKFVY